jgi:two-component system C4-dicarboxylate transport response regulator DctD
VRFGLPEPAPTESDAARWREHGWPGNVRELCNDVERACLGIADAGERPAEPAEPASLAARVDRFERAIIEQALARAGGDVAAAAAALRLPRNTLYDKLKRHGLAAPQRSPR